MHHAYVEKISVTRRGGAWRNGDFKNKRNGANIAWRGGIKMTAAACSVYCRMANGVKTKAYAAKGGVAAEEGGVA